MAPYQRYGSARYGNHKKDLPSGYTYIGHILGGTIPVGRLVNVVGLVTDFQAPIPTKGKDFKCAITIVDNSGDGAGLTISIFRPEDRMPDPMAGDVLVITAAKVQSYRDDISLITNLQSSLYVFTASQIPRPPRSAEVALRGPLESRQLPGPEQEYVSWFYHHTNKDAVPDPNTFQFQVDRSKNQREKFCKLENVIQDQFCDVIANVVKEPYDDGDKTTLWVSDYTENVNFHKFSWKDPMQIGPYDGQGQAAAKWTGPFGQRSIQVTCFGLHASDVNSDVKLDDWVHIRNMRIKLANNGQNLEGALHEDRDYGHRRSVNVLDLDDRGNCDPRLKEAIRRKIEYAKLKKNQIKSLRQNGGDGANPSVKRKADTNSDDGRPNAKTRRKEMREAAMRKVEQQEQQAEERLGLSDHVKCESDGQPVTPVSSIVKPCTWKTTVDREEVIITLPFSCAKYRTHARVVDFRPRKLQDFAAWRTSTESDLLSDYSSGSDSELESESEDEGGLQSQVKIKTWEWRFALQLEDADPKSKKEKERFWAVVDNTEAQQLTGLDACDLREDAETLNALREQLFKLWGNLEEVKLQQEQHQIKNRKRVAAGEPPPSSPARENLGSRNGEGDDTVVPISNKPFICCIRQYGVRVREPDLLRADAGEGRRWTRVFGIFGTRICP
ncbi:hypothetical protein GGS20DRAFT_40446 [Poronia punctata]|nr:hypothetical protein GGS20DRAFT_40446 [Poronia punctata]